MAARLFALAIGVLLVVRWTAPALLETTPFGAVLLDRDGRLMRLSLAHDERYRVYTALAEIAPEVIDATLLYEDRYFRWHPGVNPVALANAALDAATGASRHGASTVTMQLARLRFGLKTTTVIGKLCQILRALQLEAAYSKDEILEAYLNLAPYGGNVEGVGAASLVYFGKQPRALSRAESVALAVMPQSPNRRGPTRDGWTPPAMRAARDRLTERWQSVHPSDQAQTFAAGEDLAVRRRDELPFFAPHVCNALLAEGVTGYVQTTIDRDAQSLLTRRIEAAIRRGRSHGITNAAAMLVDVRSMEVLASVGSAAFDDVTISGQVDGTRAKRSPGSTLKPFVYALALEHGLIHPRSVLEDAPTRYGIYEPENFDGQFAGPLSATEALTRSRNVPAVSLESHLQEEPDRSLDDLLRRAGITDLKSREHYGLSHVLGSAELTMRELVGLYAALANGGVMRPLHDVVASHAHDPETRLVSPEAAQLVLQMLASSARPNATMLANVRDSILVAWKTGTSWGSRDAWTVAVTGQYALAVWVGNFDARGNPAFVGRTAAAPLAFEIIDALRPSIVERDATKLTSITSTEVCSISGKIAGPHCPHKTHTSFIANVSPIDVCDVHREIVIDDTTGARACPGEGAGEGRHAQVFEVWPSNLAAVFDRAGLPRHRPPAYATRCKLDERVAIGKPPRITSPQAIVTYNMRLDDPASNTVPFAAVTDADAHEVRWFVDDRYVGLTPAGVVLMWEAKPGDYVVRAVDDNGRSDSERLRVVRVE